MHMKAQKFTVTQSLCFYTLPLVLFIYLTVVCFTFSCHYFTFEPAAGFSCFFWLLLAAHTTISVADFYPQGASCIWVLDIHTYTHIYICIYVQTCILPQLLRFYKASDNNDRHLVRQVTSSAHTSSLLAFIIYLTTWHTHMHTQMCVCMQKLHACDF